MSSAKSEMVALMCMTPSQFQAGWRRGRVLQWFCVALAWGSVGGAAYLLSLSDLHQFSPPSGNLGDVFGSVVRTASSVALLPLSILLCAVVLVPSGKYWLGSRTQRTVILAGESKLIPAAIDQPTPLKDAELPRDVSLFRPLKSLVGTSNLLTTLLAFTLLLSVSAIISVFWLEPHRPLMSPLITLAQLALAFLTTGRIMSSIGGPQFLMEGWGALLPARRARLLAVDNWGIRWRARGWRTSEKTLAWQDVAAFCVYHNSDTTSSKITNDIYVVMSSDLSFAWTLPHRSKSAARAASELLSRLVVTRTHKSLLDITQRVETVDVWTQAAAKPRTYERDQRSLAQLVETERSKSNLTAATEKVGDFFSELYEKRAHAEGMAPLHRTMLEEIERHASPARPIRLRARFYWLNALLIVLIALATGGALEYEQRQLPAYYRTLPAQIAAATPVYRSPLTAPNTDWPLRGPTVTNTTTYQYTHGGYAITGGPAGYTLEAIMRIRFGDIAVAVTVRQIGTAYNDGIGLVARSLDRGANEYDKIVFMISPTKGFWTLYHYQPGHNNSDDNWRYLDGGDSAAIHTGADAVNRLLLVLRGTEYLCYVNNQFVGRHVDTTVISSSPRSGFTGLIINDDMTVGVFNDFTVYPAPAPYQPLLHGL